MPEQHGDASDRWLLDRNNESQSADNADRDHLEEGTTGMRHEVGACGGDDACSSDDSG